MADCIHCGVPLGLIHRCKMAPAVPPAAPLEERARQALMMNDAGYPVDPLALELAAAYLRLLEAADG